MTMVRPTLIHIHIPKTAGSTLNFVLSQALGEHRQFLCARSEDAEELAAMSQAERDQIDFIFGHYPYGLRALFTRPARYMTCLRDPRQRILSFYRFVLAQEDHPLHDTVRQKNHDFSSFLRRASEDPHIQDPVDNVQVRMLAGHMRLQAEYDDVLASALANIMAGGVLLGDMQDLSGFLARLERVLQLKFGPIPRLNASEKGASFDEEVERLAPDVQGILERFVRWDSILHSVARKIAGNGLEQISLPSHAVATSTGVLRGIAGMSSAVSEDLPVLELVRALCRVLLLREPGPSEIANHIKWIHGGTPIEKIMHEFLTCQEFVDNRTQFLQTYLPPGAATGGRVETDYMACLRESGQRVLSFYRFVLAQEDHPLYGIVRQNSHDFSSFLRLASEDPRIQDQVDNVQVRMLAGDMGLRAGYNDALALALSNMTKFMAGGVLLGDMQDLSDFPAWLERVLQPKSGPIPRLNASEEGVSFDTEMERLAPDVQEILERFVRWDSILHSVARKIARNSLEQISLPSHAVPTSTESSEVSAGMISLVSKDLYAPKLVRALYHVLLLREPDPSGFDNHIKWIHGGRPIEEIVLGFLTCQEFVDNRTQFLQTYLPPAAPPRADAWREADAE
jgi:hypothetical protein